MKLSYKKFLLTQGYDNKSADDGYSLNKTNEQKLKITSKFSGMSLENIVTDDIRMKDALSIIMRSDRPGNECQNALRMYYYFINDRWYDGWRPNKDAGEKKEDIINKVPSSLGNGDTRDSYFIRYDPEVAEEDKIPGLISFLNEEFEYIFSYLQYFAFSDCEAKTLAKCGDIIPVILKKEFPTHTYENSDEYIAKKIVKSAMNYSGDTLEKVVLGIMKEKRYREKVFGEYHHSGCPEYVIESFEFEEGRCRPYIVINYRNTYCSDEMDYKAKLGYILAHEYFHFLQDLVNSSGFDSQSAERTAVIEGTAEYFAVKYNFTRFRESKIGQKLLHGNNIDLFRLTENLPAGQLESARCMFAVRRYELWSSRFGSVWPYANALHFFYDGEDCPHSLEHILMHNSKFEEVIYLILCIGPDSMHRAYERMIQD